MMARRTLLLSAVNLAAAMCLAQPPYYGETFTVQGEVWRPGKLYLQDYKRVYEAIQGSGGLKNDADRKISIHRGAKEYTFDYGAYLRGERIEENIFLENGDVILVAQSPYYSETFTLEGKVWRPGKFQIQGYKRAYDAIQDAGGLKNDADRKISIHRGAKEYIFDYGAYQRGERIGENILLENRDVIVVR